MTLFDLWLPVLVSAVLVFIVSAVFHMVLPIHRGDYGKLPGEPKLLAAMRTEGVRPGTYMFPCPASMKDMGSPEMIAKYKEGPVGFVTVIPSGPPAMGKNLAMWFVYCLVVGVFAGYLGRLALDPGATYHAVFRVVGTAAILGHAVGSLQDSIWKGVRWGVTAKFVFDGVIYGLVTAGTFAWLWPEV